jgi:hypothetical protein
MQDFWHYNDAAYLVLATVLAVVAAAILALSWRDSLLAIGEFFSPLSGRRPKYRLIHLFILLAVCSVVFKVAALLNWSAANWVNAFSLLATVFLGASLLGLFISLFWADNFERTARLRGPDTVPQRRDKTPQGSKQKNKKVRFADRRRPTSGFKW